MHTKDHATLSRDFPAYSLMAKLLHWTMAVLIFAVAGMGIYMTPYDADGASTELLYVGHKSFGVILLFLWVLRVSIKILSRPLGPIAGLKTYEVKLSKAVHLTFYLLLMVPVLGYVQSSSYAEGGGVSFFGSQLPEF